MLPETRFIRKMCKAGWKHEVVWHPEWTGRCKYKTKTVSINVLRAIATVIIHEHIHTQHPKWSEKQVLRAETARREVLTKAGAIALIKGACPKLYRKLKED
mgnify:CR=1 FL=1